MPIQIYLKFYHQKIENFQIKNSDIFHISAQKLDCEYSLKPPRRGGSNEYPQSMFCAEIRKIMYTPVNPCFTVWKWGLRGSKLYRHVFVMYIPIWEKFSPLWIISLFEIHGHFTSEQHIIEDTQEMHITKTCLYNFDPSKPPLLYSKTGVYKGIYYLSYFCLRVPTIYV